MIFIMTLSAQKESFDHFITKFAQDSVFQFSRIVFPLKCITWDLEKDEESFFYLPKDKWKYTRLYYKWYDKGYDGHDVWYDNFDCKFKDTGEMVYQVLGFTDMDIRYYFKQIEEKWFLVQFSNYDMEIPK